jgi:CHAT domain
MQKHTILFLAASPTDTDRLALDREARSIQVELERSGHRDQFEFVTRWAAEPLDLLRELRKLKPAVVHYSGHGRHNGLDFQSSDGRAHVVSTAAIAETFGAAGASVKLVVLSACYTEEGAETLLAHVDCVVGMDGAILDDAARSFAIGFYGGLGERESVALAYKQGCAAISLEERGDRERSEHARRDVESSPGSSIAGARPRLKVRTGVDANRLVLADPS